MNNYLKSLAILCIFLGLWSCSSSSSSEQAQKNGPPPPAVSENVELEGAQDPSPIDPSNPPLVKLSPTTFHPNHTPPYQVTISSEHFPLAVAWQELALLINNNAPLMISQSPYTIDFSVHIQEGLNYIRVFPTRSWGEIVKSETSMDGFYFYKLASKKQKKLPTTKVALNLFFPQSEISLEQAKRFLIDYTISEKPNTIAPANHRYYLRYQINQEKPRILTASKEPLILMNLSPGTYQLKFDLLNHRKKPVASPFSSVQRTLVICANNHLPCSSGPTPDK